MPVKRTIKRQIQDSIPTESFPHIYDEIFSHLNVEALCAASEACSSWLSFIESSTKIMQRLTMCIDFSMPDQKSLEVLQLSKRKYVNLKIKHFIEPQLDIKKLLELHQWKSINLFSQFVAFPILDPACVSNLTSLEINTIAMSHVIHLLQSCPNLKQLKLQLTHITSADDWSKICLKDSFKLESLCLHLSPYMLYRTRNVHQFLKTQVGSIIKLDLEGVIVNQKLLETISEMTKLQNLAIRKVFYEFRNDLKMKSLPLLQTLKLIDNNSIVANQKFFLIAKIAPNIKQLEVNVLNQQRINFIGSNFPNLKQLRASSVNFYDLSDQTIFPQLEAVNIFMGMAEKYQKMIIQQVEENLTNFNLCLYEELLKKHHIKVAIDSITLLVEHFHLD